MPGSVLLSLEIQPTIIGPKVFHGPVRNGKEWFRPGMAARQELCRFGLEVRFSEFLGEKKQSLSAIALLSRSFNAVNSVQPSDILQHGYRIKPHRQLVPIDSTSHNAFIFGLSTF